MRINDKKKELFSFLAERIASLQPSNFVCSTQRENVLCNNNIDRSGIRPCIHEETDTWIFVHVKHAAVHELKTSLLINTDTDVAVLAISMFEKLEKDRSWIAFGKVKDLRWIPIHGVSISFGLRALGVIFVHVFIGCDRVLVFRGKGKRTA